MIVIYHIKYRMTFRLHTSPPLNYQHDTGPTSNYQKDESLKDNTSTVHIICELAKENMMMQMAHNSLIIFNLHQT